MKILQIFPPKKNVLCFYDILDILMCSSAKNLQIFCIELIKIYLIISNVSI